MNDHHLDTVVAHQVSKLLIRVLLTVNRHPAVPLHVHDAKSLPATAVKHGPTVKVFDRVDDCFQVFVNQLNICARQLNVVVAGIVCLIKLLTDLFKNLVNNLLLIHVVLLCVRREGCR